MTQLNNLSALPVDSTTTYFNNFFKPEFDVSQNLDEAVIGFFERITSNKSAARAMAGAVIYTAKAQNMDPMAVLNQFSKLPPGQLSDYLTMFLNLNRIGTSFLGINNAPTTSKYISRTILP